MKLHMIGGPYAGCLLDLDLWPLIGRPIVNLPGIFKPLPIADLSDMSKGEPVANAHPASYRLETIHFVERETVQMMVYEGSTTRDSFLDLLATHREISEQKGPASSLKGRLPRGIS